jgi:hypothetical protein
MASPFESSMYLFDWQTISIAAAALSVLGSVLLIMFSRLLDLKNLEQVAKTEFVYAASTVFIVLFVLMLVQYGEAAMKIMARELFLTSLAYSPSTPVNLKAGDTLIDYAKLYLYAPTGCVQTIVGTLYWFSIPVEGMSSVFMEIFMSEHASGFAVKWIAERITNTTQVMTFFMFIYYILFHAFDFIKYFGGFFFSVGVALRAFPPTRGAGAYLMALALGLYFILPLSYILVSAMSMPHLQPGFQQAQLKTDGNIAYACKVPSAPDVELCGSESIAAAAQWKVIIKQRQAELEKFLDIHVFELTRHLTMAMCVFPTVCMIIVLTFVLNTTQLFGGNIPEIGRGLIKLI